MEDLEQYRKYIDIEKLKELKKKDDEETELSKQPKIHLDAPIGLNPKMVEWEKRNEEMEKNISKMSPEDKKAYYYYKRWNPVIGWEFEDWKKNHLCYEEYDKRDVVKNLNSQEWIKDQIETNDKYKYYQDKEKLKETIKKINDIKKELNELDAIIKEKNKNITLKYNIT